MPAARQNSLDSLSSVDDPSAPALRPRSLVAVTPPPSLAQQARRFQRWATEWIKGPQPPADVSFRPFFPELQSWPVRTFERVCKRRRIQLFALVSYLFVWFVLFVAVVHYSSFADSVEGLQPVHLTCTSSFWLKNGGCGLDGEECLPFDNNTLPFRCPANCISSGRVLNPRAVGAELVSYTNFVIGGPSPDDVDNTSIGTYRGDSFICVAAIHAGIASDRFGGCGAVSQTGTRNNFPASERNGISSIPFDSTFPSSFTFLKGISSSSCRDLRWHLFAVSIPFTTVISIVSPSAAVTFFSVFTSFYFHVALASDPPSFLNPYDIVSSALSGFLPAIFVAYVLWRHVLQPIHNSPLLLSAAIEKSILFLGGLWVGALTNITFDAIIPITRLTARDLNQEPGAKAALSIIIIILACIVVGQIHYLRLSGQLPKMLALYIAMGVGLGFLAAIPGTSLRIHHYILALLLLPGCRVLTRPALFYQGLLLGLFINGIARWGFDAIVQSPGSLIGDGLLFSGLLHLRRRRRLPPTTSPPSSPSQT